MASTKFPLTKQQRKRIFGPERKLLQNVYKSQTNVIRRKKNKYMALFGLGGLTETTNQPPEPPQPTMAKSTQTLKKRIEKSTNAF